MTILNKPFHATRAHSRGVNTVQAIILHEINESASQVDGRMQTALTHVGLAHQSYHYAVDASAIRAYVPITDAVYAIADTDTMSPWTVALANPGIDPDLYTVNVAVLIGTANLPNPCLPGCGREYPPTLLTNLQELLAYIAEEAGLDLETPNIVWKHGTELCDLDLEPLLLPIEEPDSGQSDWLCDRLADLPVGQSDPTAVVGTDCVAYTPAQVVEAGLCEVLEALDAGVGVPTALVGADCETYTPAQVVTVGLCDALEALEAGESEAPMLVGSDCGLYPMPVFVPDTDWTVATLGGRHTPASTAAGQDAFAAGNLNTASGPNATVGGGTSNTASAASSTVSGGVSNTASGENATVGGGSTNTANANFATVGGGANNTASYYATVGGGSTNTASGYLATVGGGANNTASGQKATVGGGYTNTANGNLATVGGGTGNTASGNYATVGGGTGNTASGNYATVGGGTGNTASGNYATVGGGSTNIADGNYATVGGGSTNIADGRNSAILGGTTNDTNEYANAMIVGSNITASLANALHCNRLVITEIPVASAGLPSGAVWSDESGTLKIVP